VIDIDFARRRRRWLDLRQADVAELVGVDVETLARWERGRNEPPLSKAVAWAQALNVPLDKLLTGSNVPEEETAP
jgi:transcriptional regulator with XRE-family HTH domain